MQKNEEKTERFVYEVKRGFPSEVVCLIGAGSFDEAWDTLEVVAPQDRFHLGRRVK